MAEHGETEQLTLMKPYISRAPFHTGSQYWEVFVKLVHPFPKAEENHHFSFFFIGVQFSSVQSLSCVQLFATPRTAACQASLFITNSQSLLKLMLIESVMPSKHLILCCPLLLLPSIFPSLRVFFNESVFHIRWPKYWSFSFSISPSKEYSGLISISIDLFDILAVQGTLKSLLQHHSSKASILQCSALYSNFHIHTGLLEVKP